MHDELYALGTRLLLLPLRPRALRVALTWPAKVWLRHSRIVSHLARARYDAVVDGGAAVGEFAALVRLALPEARLLCVEPHPASAAALRRRGFEVVEAALWNADGESVLTQPGPAATSCSLIGSGEDAERSWRVRTVRLDRLPIEGRRILVKLDLQGAERAALEGMDALWPRCAGLLLEVSYGASGSYEPLRALVAAQGFAEAATLNELETDAGIVEADKLFLRRGALG
jgi:FkbM family methyltransferase